MPVGIGASCGHHSIAAVIYQTHHAFDETTLNSDALGVLERNVSDEWMKGGVFLPSSRCLEFVGEQTR